MQPPTATLLRPPPAFFATADRIPPARAFEVPIAVRHFAPLTRTTHHSQAVRSPGQGCEVAGSPVREPSMNPHDWSIASVQEDRLHESSSCEVSPATRYAPIGRVRFV
jgi:hypothetical protein